MTKQHDADTVVRRVQQAAEHALSAVGMTPATLGWLYHSISFSRRKGARFTNIWAVEPTGAPRYEEASIDHWSDIDLSYHLELLSLRVRAVREQPPQIVRWGEPVDTLPADGKLPTPTLVILRARVVKPGAPVFGQFDWRPGWTEPEYSYGGVTPGGRNDLHAADIGFRLLATFQAVERRGRKTGDGANWPGGLDDFLADLWDTVDRYTTQTGRPWLKITGKAGTSFRTMMRGCPAERTLRTWLGRAELRPHDIESGKVTRVNYRQFVAEQRP